MPTAAGGVGGGLRAVDGAVHGYHRLGDGGNGKLLVAQDRV